MKKYKLGQKLHNRLYRIIALRDFGNVKAGELGGWVESEKNLSHDGHAWIYDNAKVYGDAGVSENARVSGDAGVSENARVSGNAKVYGDAGVSENARVSGNAEVYGNAWVEGNARVYQDALVRGDAEVYGEAEVYGNARVSGNAEVYGKDIVTKRTITISGLPRDNITVTDNHVTIGCKQRTLEYWLENYKEIGREHKYSEKEIECYYLQLQSFKCLQ
jgi:carbonic anhydrase/acetyltransferase-like protein (isoleucine patch superfamily)